MLSPAMPVPPKGLLAPLQPGGGCGGAVVFSGVSLVYPSTGRMALRNVCFMIEAGQRLGVCGRTGRTVGDNTGLIDGCFMYMLVWMLCILWCRCWRTSYGMHSYCCATIAIILPPLLFNTTPICAGSGKSSLVAAITRLTDICAGTITINGVSIAAVRLGELRRAVAVVGQEPFLFAGSVRDNIDPECSFSNGALYIV